ncbi:MAG: ATP-binding protein [Alphaproteobacteria bacterium]|nr:ATP-binding protein [Alphaproteobacteria bacterium]
MPSSARLSQISAAPRRSWLAIAALLFISFVYVLAALTLLRSQHAEIVFTEQERRGLEDYRRLLPLYLDLQRSGNVQDVVQGLAPTPPAPDAEIWQAARQALTDADPLPDAAAATLILRRLIRDIGDRSNLILDPGMASYYAVSLLFNDVPLLAAGTFTRADRDGFDHAVAILSSRQMPEAAALRAEAAASPPDETGHRDSLAHAENVAAAAEQILDRLLSARLARQQQRYSDMVSIIAGLYFCLLALIAVAARNYVSRREVALAADRQALIRDLASKNDELEKFVYAAAHDLKEPVRTMHCFATLLKNEAGPQLDAAAAGYVETIEHTAGRAEQMINDLLGYTQVSEEVLALEACDCGREVAAVLADLKPLVAAAQTRVRVENMPTLRTVPSMFRRVMLNLIDNAVKYRKPGRPLDIRIAAARGEEGWLFSVEDNGIGIARGYSETVFEPFKRLHAGAGPAGNGIGLTSCKKIVERLGGKISILSEPGQGTTVSFTLPDEAAPPAFQALS